MIKHKLTNQNLDLKESICKRITNPFYLIAVALTALGAYGFYLANPSPSIDWLSYDLTDITAVYFSVREDLRQRLSKECSIYGTALFGLSRCSDSFALFSERL